MIIIITTIIIPIITHTDVVRITVIIMVAITEVLSTTVLMVVLDEERCMIRLAVPIIAVHTVMDPMVVPSLVRLIIRIQVGMPGRLVLQTPMAPGVDPWFPMVVIGRGQGIDQTLEELSPDLKPRRGQRELLEEVMSPDGQAMLFAINMEINMSAATVIFIETTMAAGKKRLAMAGKTRITRDRHREITTDQTTPPARRGRRIITPENSRSEATIPPKSNNTKADQISTGNR